MAVFDRSPHNLAPTGLTMDERGYWVAFNRIQGIGPVSFRLLLNHFQNDLAAAWQADSRELARVGFSQKFIEKFLAQRVRIEPAREIELLTKENVSLLTWCDPTYPALL